LTNAILILGLKPLPIINSPCFQIGCKIKALRAKTNTYIKTPVRGEEPVFIVTGQRGSVLLARQEILSAADHFTQLRATRRNNINSTLALGQIMSNNPGQVTVQVKVPYSAVGLVS
jgi:RNA-binding protein MEX3